MNDFKLGPWEPTEVEFLSSRPPQHVSSISSWTFRSWSKSLYWSCQAVRQQLAQGTGAIQKEYYLESQYAGQMEQSPRRAEFEQLAYRQDFSAVERFEWKDEKKEAHPRYQVRGEACSSGVADGGKSPELRDYKEMRYHLSSRTIRSRETL